MNIELMKLHAPFPAADVEWRLQECGEKNGKIWAMCLAYITSRAIMQRLDDVCGPENWKNQYASGPQGGVICGISIKCGEDWVCKWDGADNTAVEATKGGLSDAMKRAGVQWGIGRYLYNLEAGFANVCDNGEYRGKTKTGTFFKWNAPTLPKWALPGNTPAPVKTATPDKAPEIPPAKPAVKMTEAQKKYFPRAKAALQTLFGDDQEAKRRETVAQSEFLGDDGVMVAGKELYWELSDARLQVVTQRLESAVAAAVKNAEAA